MIKKFIFEDFQENSLRGGGGYPLPEATINVGRDSTFSLAFMLSIEEELFACFFKKDRFKINAPNSFFKMSKNSVTGIYFWNFQQVFENLKLKKLAKQERRLNVKDRI